MPSNIQDQGKSQRVIDWETFYTAADKPLIGYDAIDDKIIIIEGATTGKQDGLIYDVQTGSWSSVPSIDPTNHSRSNFASDHDGALIFKENDTSTGYSKWASAGASSASFKWQSKNLDFGYPGAKKKLYKVIVHAAHGNNLVIKAGYDDADPADLFTDTGDANTFNTTDTLDKHEFVISSPTAFSYCSIEISGTCEADLLINDIAFVYRVLSVH